MIVKLQEIFRDVLDDENLVITETMTAENVDEWDSLTHIRLIMAIEKEFGVKFQIDELDQLRSVADILNFLQRNGLN